MMTPKQLLIAIILIFSVLCTIFSVYFGIYMILVAIFLEIEGVSEKPKRK